MQIEQNFDVMSELIKRSIKWPRTAQRLALAGVHQDQNMQS